MNELYIPLISTKKKKVSGNMTSQYNPLNHNCCLSFCYESCMFHECTSFRILQMLVNKANCCALQLHEQLKKKFTPHPDT